MTCLRQQLGWASRERPVLFWHLALRRVPSGPERGVPGPTDSGIPPQSFASFAVPVCLGAAGRRVSLARCADDLGSPVGTALALGGPPQDGGTAGCVDVRPVREGFLPSGMEAASAPLDVTASASFPLRGKSVTTSTHRHRTCTTHTAQPLSSRGHQHLPVVPTSLVAFLGLCAVRCGAFSPVAHVWSLVACLVPWHFGGNLDFVEGVVYFTTAAPFEVPLEGAPEPWLHG